MNCDHAATELIPTPQGPHHAKIVCKACGSFRGWAPKPETAEKQARNARHLVALRKRRDLTEWERTFVESLEAQGPKFSPRQQERLDELAAKKAFA
jgi:hypothetical protein